MRSVSILAMAAAFALVPVSTSLAQVSVNAGTTTNSSGTVSTGTSGTTGGTTTSGSTGGSVTGGVMVEEGETDLSLDTNNNGTIDVDERATGEVDGETTTNVQIDLNGDGVISDEEQAQADANAAAGGNAGTGTAGLTEEACEDVDLDSVVGGSGDVNDDLIASATTAQIVMVGECEESDAVADLTTTGSTQVRDAIGANADLVAILQGQGLTAADVLGVTAQGDSLTIYVTNEGSLASE